MPIIPYLTDTRENVDTLYAHARDSNVSYVLPGVLYLRGKTRRVFFEFISKEYPELLEPLQALYQTGGAPKEYKDKLYQMVNPIKEKYGLSGNYSKSIKEKQKPEEYTQLSIFDL